MLVIFFAACCPYYAYSQDLKVEPPNWWFGMQDTKLQLLVKAEGIGDYEVELMDKVSLGVELLSIHKADSPNYLFLDLDLRSVSKPGSVDFIFSNSKKDAVLTYTYNITDRNQDPNSLYGFNTSDLIYLITPDRFSNGDSSNDVVSTYRETTVSDADYSRNGGDIQGIINHLDYLNDLGVTSIWSSPLLENNMPEYSYHGYAITDYYQVDQRFGDLSLYKKLSAELKKRNMKLIFDGVVNHCGSYHWWMADMPFKDWVNFPEEKIETNHTRSVHQDPYSSTVDKNRMVGGWFVETMPDLNQNNPFMANYLIQNSIWWIETLGLNGIRQDTYPYPYAEFLSKWTCRIMDEYPNFKIVGEEWSYNPLHVSYWQKGKSEELGSCLSTVMDFPMQKKLANAILEDEKPTKGLKELYEGLANDFIYEDPENLMIFLDNHDMDRIYTVFNQSSDKVKMALVYLATMRGIPQMYYGTEVLADNTGFNDSHGKIRSRFPGGFPGDESSAKENSGLDADKAEMLGFVKKLMNWRKETKLIHEGKLMHFFPEDGCYVYFRYNDKEKVMVVLNKGKERKLDLSRYKELLNAHRAYKPALSEEDWSIAPSSLNIPVGASIFAFK
jgi:glycosidase